jgi:hypothetical protein
MFDMYEDEFIQREYEREQEELRKEMYEEMLDTSDSYARSEDDGWFYED